MKNILMIAPRSIPVYGAEEIVNYKLLKAFSADGRFKIDLISRRNKTVDYPVDSADTASLKLNSHIEIEVDNRVTHSVAWQHCRAFAKFGCVFRGAHWAAQAAKAADELVARNEYDYVLTKSESSFLLGYYLKKKYGVKWVATWNDPYPFYKCPSPYGGGPGASSLFDKRIMAMLQTADVHIFANSRLRDYVLSYIDIDKAATRIVPHVVIRKDTVMPKPVSFDGSLKLIASGNMRSPRDPKPFLRALKRLVAELPAAKISFTMLGLVDPEIEGEISRLKLEGFVNVFPPVTYGESLRALSDFDVAVIFEAPCVEGIFLPTKVSDYMQSGVNIFAVSPSEGVLHDLFADSKIGYFASVGDEEAIYQELKRLYDDFTADKLFTPVISEDFFDNIITDTYLNL